MVAIANKPNDECGNPADIDIFIPEQPANLSGSKIVDDILCDFVDVSKREAGANTGEELFCVGALHMGGNVRHDGRWGQEFSTDFARKSRAGWRFLSRKPGYHPQVMTQTPVPPPAPKPGRILPGTAGLIPALAVLAVLALAAVFVTSDPPKSGPDKVPWRHAQTKAEISVNTTGKPMLIFFTADWCGPCTLLKQTTFADASVAEKIQTGFVPMKVDLTDQNGPEQLLAHTWDVRAIPTMIIVSPAGKEVSRQQGVLDVQEMTTWLATAGK